MCSRRSALSPELRAKNGLPTSGPLPHVYGSRLRTLIDGEWTEWSTPKCSWCGEREP